MPRHHSPIPPDTAWPPARKAQLRRNVWKKMRKFRASAEYARMVVKEKAPGLATEGSVDLVIPGEDPGPPETQALAAVPARRATPPAQGRGGTTVLTD